LVEVDPIILTGIGVGIAAIGLLVGVLGSSFRHGKQHGEVETQIKNIMTTIDSFRPAVAYTNAVMELSKNPRILDTVRNFGPKSEKRNPYDPAVKNDLLNRYQNNTLDLNGAQELQRILQEDFQLAETTDAAAAVAIIIVLIAIVVLIAILVAAAGSAAAPGSTSSSHWQS